jgi:hypothetical protein
MTGPDVNRDTDLELIEAALTEGRAAAADPRERELQELALALQADSPEPGPEFARQLDRRVSEGFKRARPGFKMPRFWMPALAGAATLVLVVVVAISVIGGGPDRSSSSSSAQAGPSTPGMETLIAPSAGAPVDASGRRVERSAQITIATSHDKIQQAADGVGTVAESHGGYVLTSHVSTGDQGSSGGTFQLRVPARQLQATLADLSKLGHLTARSESGQDMTAPYRHVQDRLGNALLERRTLLLRLKHARGAKADDIRAQLATLNASITSLNGQMQELRRRTVYSTVDVTLEQQRAGAGAGGGTGAAFDDALHTLQALVNFVVRALGVLLPLGLLGAAAAVGTRTLRRRRREAALM